MSCNSVKLVEIIDLSGQLIIKDTDISKALVSYELPENDRVVIVKVITEDNMPTIQKVVLQ